MGGKTRTQMRSDLRLDLKDSGSLWSDAELNRCVEKAVSDLSRFKPRGKILEKSLQFAVTDESWTSPATTSLTAIVNAQSINVAAPANLTISGQPDVPRVLTLTITDADSSAYGITFTVRGMDKDEIAQTEIFHYSRGDSKTIVGKKEFKFVYEVELTSDAGSNAGDTLSVGYGLYTGAWVYLANKPIRYQSETVESSDGATSYSRDTDYDLDYTNGRIKPLAGGSLAAATAYLISYTKNKITYDLSGIMDLIRVDRVESVGDIPQSNFPFETFEKLLTIMGGVEDNPQYELSEDSHIAIYYLAEHQPPNDYTPGSIPEFLENTVLMASAAYALFIYAEKQEHQAATDFASGRTALGNALTGQTALGTALTNVKKYLDNNSSADAAGLLQDITDAAADLRTAIETALDASATHLAAAITTELAAADALVASYIGTTNYVTRATSPSVLDYLDDGDALINTITEGGENEKTPETYAAYALAVNEGIIKPYENHRTAYQRNAEVRVNAAIGLVQESSQRLSNLRSFIEQSAGYVAIASVFAREAEARVNSIGDYLQEAVGYISTANGEMALADRFKGDATERRNEVWSIWRDKREYIGDSVSGTGRQLGR